MGFAKRSFTSNNIYRNAIHGKVAIFETNVSDDLKTHKINANTIYDRENL